MMSEKEWPHKKLNLILSNILGVLYVKKKQDRVTSWQPSHFLT